MAIVQLKNYLFVNKKKEKNMENKEYKAFFKTVGGNEGEQM